ncbi:glycosyltransferase family 2 protein [Desulfosediminicola flagellatus]|uniref:glycosyltransferase family 2 protein n=1 Tax=Desulfosediminicola flagellatus TaxID=2569541 RepID=UPI0010ABFB76|nr:glycosyltransferase family 2 protein [Desulfosediminicola flagellatus]
MSQAVEVTVVICVYNAEGYIEETLQSLADQTFQSFKILLIDDCSTDSSFEVAESFLNAKGRLFKSVRLNENRGTAYVRNLALHEVDTPLMMFFDADDVALPTLVQRLYERIQEDADLIAVGSHCSYMDEYSKPLSGGIFLGPKTRTEFEERSKNGKMLFMLPPSLFRREYAIAAGGYVQEGFPEGGRRYQDLSEDVDLWTRMTDCYQENLYMVVVPEPLFRYRKNCSSLSGSKESLFAMQYKLKYIKNNLLRRRSGRAQLTFIEFINSLRRGERIKMWFKNYSAYFYRMAGFAYVRKNYVLFFWGLFLSVLLNPFYLIDKFKHNILRK